MNPVDEKSWRILAALQEDARAPLKTLAETAGLSVPATAERIRKMEEAGIIRGYHADVAPEALGYVIKAVVAITTQHPYKQKFIEVLRAKPQVLECLHVTGADSVLFTVVAKDMADLEQFLASINKYGETRTSIVMSAQIPRRGVQRF
ncbi:MAG TPA: Lrp/AsnC family transcriptional regulator [Noviherbaspirillum sp.]|uniref:Lrp/AsnC family transcriptional regulator n=1 Tax=Noviherbaspirillum sp. TaxID=1926288 RepID=UPI002D2C136B|nr:Lrp/AsnC family transcriptional regulator [Noviherbaspirillum sp.]HYD94935.1 Lrp/AsnC family transcriptional regulator [Noviherbaspirillum sp.]